jgi:FkbM family methyltransferase
MSLMESGEANALARSQDQRTVEIQLDSDVGRYTIQVIEGDFFQHVLASQRPYEEDLLRITTSLTKPGDRIIDVGANLGNHSVYWGLSGRRVIAFEPNPSVNAVLRANVERNGLSSLVDVRMAALGRQEGTGTAKQRTPANSGTVVIEAGAGEVAIHPLDSLNLDGFTLLKIDVEGYEADVLAGAVQTLREWRPYIVAEELSGHEVVDDLISGIGYRRLPVNLEGPIRIYSPSTRATLRVITLRPYQRLATRAVMNTTRAALRVITLRRYHRLAARAVMHRLRG